MFIVPQRSRLFQPQIRQTTAFFSTRRRLDVAIVGAPNAGKSQLLNQLLGQNLAAVSRKSHTTRTSLLGARTLSNTQLAFWDTPGYQTFKHNTEGDRELRTAALRDMESVDYTLLVIDAARSLFVDSGRPKDDQYYETILSLILTSLESEGREEITLEEDDDEEAEEEATNLILPKFGIVLNKVDLVKPKTDLLIIMDQLSQVAENCIKHYLENTEDDQIKSLVKPEDMFPQFFYTDSLKAEGTDDVLQYLQALATPSKVWAVQGDNEITDLSLLERMEEIIREKIYRTLHRELPHSIHQIHRGMKETKDGVVVINQDLVVKTKSHYRIVRGRNLKAIELSAQHDLQKNLFPGKQVVLKLHVAHSKSQHSRSLESAIHGGTQQLILNKNSN